MQQNMNTQQVMKDYTQGNQFDPNLSPSPDDTPAEAARKNLLTTQQQAVFARGLATAIAKGGGNPKDVNTWIDNARDASYRATYAAREYQTEQKNLNAQLASVADTAKDDETANAAVQQLISLGGAKMVAGLTFDRDQQNGNVIWGPTTKRTFDSIKAAGTTYEQRANLLLKAQAEQDRQKIEERRVAKEKSDENVATARIANLQAGTKYHEAQTSALGATGSGGIKITVPEQRTNAEIDQARREVANLTPDQASKYFDAASSESVRNPSMMESIRKAATLKYGPDPEYEAVRAKLSPAANSLASRNAQPKPATAPAPQAAPATTIPEGSTATATDGSGKKLIRKNGQWVPLTQ
jgi:hypothetical protein